MRKSEDKKSPGKSRSIWEDNITINTEKQNVRMWTGFIWLRIGFSGGLF
jgi:hypothetical protein